jgi:hypothetical protein
MNQTYKTMKAPRKKLVCIYLCHLSQVIKDTTGSGESYIDSYYKCSKLQTRITKKHCRVCVFYKPLINKADEINN